MKAIELMIGDWVKSRGKIEKVNSVYEGYICTDSFEDSHDYYFEPIPLTPEILEKNGFEKEKLTKVTIWQKGDFSMEFNAMSNRFYYGEVVMDFVHQFQHLIRLCGIEKEIIL